MLVSFIWVALLHYQPAILKILDYNIRSYQIFMLVWVVSYFGTILGTLWLVHRNQLFENQLSAFAERLSLLAVFYLAFDLFGFLLLAFRYIG